MDQTAESKQLREFIRILERKLGLLQESEFACCGITMGQCHALVEIGRAGSISLIDLSEVLNLENSTMSRTVNNLVTNGYAKRDIAAQDRRYVTISLTESGMKLFESIECDMYDYFEKVLASVPDGKRAQVLESLKLLLDAIDKTDCCK